ncbi:hypothetical protein FXF51_06305 [Nonomuraea sp. PA05]|uniref:hypothetical protein n=1 Tax=Nonomuraea sp. PA05 TaxID=2604466 RepID=UPI0011DB0EE4|nr:hypothetical protein [Nonomuraea sp. PA05]TYB69773.1 hypothetical protein FXF51_06305 [Nonomuraea sp. PA05]
MSWMVVAWLVLLGVITTCVIVKVTRWYELLFIGSFGFLTATLLAGVTTPGGLAFENLWGAIF